MINANLLFFMIPSEKNLDGTSSSLAGASNNIRHRSGDVLSLLCCVGMIFCVVKLRTFERHFEDISQRLVKQIESEGALKATPVTEAETKRSASEIEGRLKEFERHFEDISQRLAKQIESVGALKAPPVAEPEKKPSASEFEYRLKGLENFLHTPTLRSLAVSKPETFKESVLGCLRLTPSDALSQWLPRINVVRWGEQAIILLSQARSATADQWDRIVEASNDLLANVPEGTDDGLVRDVTTANEEAVAAFDDYKRNQAMNAAAVEIESSQTTVAAELWLKLDQWKDHPTEGNKIKKLRKELRDRIVIDEINALDSKLKSLKGKLSSEPTLLRAGLGHLLDSSISQRLSLLEDVDASQAAEKKSKELHSRIEAELDALASQRRDDSEKRQGKYQGWALDQIKLFDEEFEIAKKLKKGTIVDGLDYNRVKSSMIERLLPISQSHLEPAVLRLFQASFDKGWRTLDDQKNLQTQVAKEEATTKKQFPYSE